MGDVEGGLQGGAQIGRLIRQQEPHPDEILGNKGSRREGDACDSSATLQKAVGRRGVGGRRGRVGCWAGGDDGGSCDDGAKCGRAQVATCNAQGALSRMRAAVGPRCGWPARVGSFWKCPVESARQAIFIMNERI